MTQEPDHQNSDSQRPEPDETATRAADSSTRVKRRHALFIAGGSVAAALIVAALVAAAIHGATPQPGAGVANALDPVATQLSRPSDVVVPTPTDGATDAPTTTPAASSPGKFDARFGGVVASTAQVAQEVKTPGGLTASVASVEPFTATARRSGEVSGPAVKVTLKLRNGTDSAFALSTATVNAYYGAALTPAAPVQGDPVWKPFTGSLQPGATATAVYVFTVPSADSGDVALTVSDQAGAQLVVFR